MTSTSILESIEESRKELLDLSLRNPLLNYRSLRARGVEMVGESAAQVFKILVVDGRPMSFLAGRPSHGVQSEWADEDGFNVGQPEDVSSSPIRANQSDRRLQTDETSENLQKRLLNTYRLANTAIEETGVNTLFIALGMLCWYEADQSDVEHKAPLVLVPAQLQRDGIRENFRVSCTGEDIGANLSLIEKARADFGLVLPGQDMIDQVADGTIDIGDYFVLVEQSIQQSRLQGWRVDRDSVVLGFFSYNKIQMFRDLDNDVWPDRAGIVENPIISALFGDGFREPASAIPQDGHLDTHFSPQDTYHVLDADSSQSLAVHDANGGRNLVIQGPPGTGKSQTITNIIAEAIARNKRVLFVSEKMAALEVVKRRLDNIGLGQACLELHSHKTNKREMLNDLDRALKSSDSFRDRSTSGFDELARVRDQLNDYDNAINNPVGVSTITPNDAFGQLLINGGDETPNPIGWTRVSQIDKWSKADFLRKREGVEDLRLRLQRTGVPRHHPFWGSALRVLLPAGQAELREKIEVVAHAVANLEDTSSALANSLRLNRPTNANGTVALLDDARLVVNAPDVSGLNLAAPQWKSHAGLIKEVVDSGFQWQRIHQQYDDVLLPYAWDSYLSNARHVLNTTGRGFFGRLFSSDYREVCKRLSAIVKGDLPREVDGKIALVDAIEWEKRIRAHIGAPHSEMYKEATVALGDRWIGILLDWDAAAPGISWWLEHVDRASHGLVRVMQMIADHGRYFTGQGISDVQRSLDAYRSSIRALESALELNNQSRFGDPDGLTSLPFSEQRQVFGQWIDRLAEVQDIIGFGNAVDVALKEGLHPVVSVAEQNPEAATSLTTWFDRAWYESIVGTAFVERPALRDFDGKVHEGRIERFQALDKQSLDSNCLRVTAAHLKGVSRLNDLPDRLPRLRADEGKDSENAQIRRRLEQLRLLQREIQKRSRHKPIRRLIIDAGDIIQDLKPVFMMSPLSIANYLEPGTVEFDLIVFDEASQVRPVDALGALLRGEKAVVVGDSRQLPPTSFFDRVSHGDDDSDDSVTGDIESILGLFTSKGAPSRELRWHYRSRHESLIAVSNREFYENNLVVFPSPDNGRDSSGLRFHHLPDAVFDRGRSAANRQEADVVARAVMDHASRNPELSLGVAAFSVRQAQAIQDQLEMLRRQDNSCEEFFSDHPEEPFFVKNLENVQGDERDVIFISVGYGRDVNGQVSMNFGPLNGEGGERRLNVLITRAKRQCHVFTNLRSDDIDLNRTQSIGVRALKAFLAYAETGVMPEDLPYESAFAVDSPFQRAVAKRLRERGYEVHDEVATAGKFIDIGIVDPDKPGRYLIGIECDGASYHSARSARDRDRLREEVLHGLGWKLYRIWSTDWFRNPERELERAVDAIERAKAESS